MGVAFALGFILILLLIVGLIGILTGVIVLVIRYVKKKKKQKKYILSQIVGILCLVIGLMFVSIPVVVGGFAGSQFIGDFAMFLKQEDFFFRHEKTAVQIPVEEESIHAGKVYWKNSFVYNSKEYFEVPGLSVIYGDMYRGHAVANLNDGVTELTVYKYLFPANCELLCAGASVYCTKEKMDELIKYYNDECNFTYQYRYSNYSSSYYVDMEMNDEMFLGLINYEEAYVTDLAEYSGFDVQYYIIQSTGDGRFDRKLSVSFDPDGTIIVRANSNPLGRNDEYIDAVYHYVVTDEESQQFLREIGERVKAEKEKYN